ncbi:VOC family protein [Oceanobacillus bengalensis]|uniref:Glyoxalase n=1 Tax=Oceanobacillus bengalensis TaxID=1435466 RepID=A0A494Z9J3_9BACI|nr:VOC family protein [Oceanobacillus bengalensis]RKQ18719.1 glyoxalase [Oceanobacillus bengalensis]
MKFNIESIDHVQLAAPVGGEEKAREFYKGLLGFQEIEKAPLLQKNGGVWFAIGAVHLHIGIEDPFIPARKAHPAIRVRNLASMKKYLMDQNVSFQVDNKLPGANRFYLSDPFGNRIEFLEWL